MRFRDYYEVREWLESFIPLVYGKEELGLDRIRYLLKLLGNPQNKFKSIHVAGTSGKGSTAFYIARLLQSGSVGSPAAIKKRSANHEISSIGLISPRSGLRPHQILKGNSKDNLSGLRHVFDWQHSSRSMSNVSGSPREAGQLSDVKVGLHISPHLVDIRERMQIFSSPRHPGGIRQLAEIDRVSKLDSIASFQNDNSLIPMNRFIRLMNEIKPVVEKIQKEKPELVPSYFEILVAASFKYFAQEKVDWAVVEVGLGGRLDATNVLQPLITLITNVGLDHTEILGKTVEKIAWEKAGIIKDGVPVVTGCPSTYFVRSGSLNLHNSSGSSRKALEVIKKVAKENGSKVITIDTQSYKNILSELPNYVQPQNAVLALSVMKQLKILVGDEIIKKAFSGRFPGRFEEIDKNIVVDGAHNPDKIRALIRWINATFDKKHLTTDEERNKLIVNSQLSIVLIVAFKKGKNWKKMVDLLIKNLPVKKIIATKFYAVTDTGPSSPKATEGQVLTPSQRLRGVNKFASLDPKLIKNYIESKSSVKCSVVVNSQEAVFEVLRFAYAQRKLAWGKLSSNPGLELSYKPGLSNVLVLITGSLYLVGEVRTMWDLPFDFTQVFDSEVAQTRGDFRPEF